MAREFELRKEVALDASPEQVWEAIATGPGITSWFMPHEVEPREGGVIRVTVGDYTQESTVTAWDPPRRFAVRSQQADDGSVHAFEYLIEGRAGGSTVLRFTHSGILGEDWEAEHDGLSQGWDMYLHTLAQYLRYFPGRTATFVAAEGPRPSGQEETWTALKRGLGLTGAVTEGDTVRLTLDGLAPIEGVVDYVRPRFLGVRTSDGLYRFHLRAAIGMPVAVGHHLYADDVDQKEAERAWQSWLSRSFA